MRAAEPPPGFYAPDPYAAKWLWIGVGILALVAAWYAWVWWSTRLSRLKLYRVSPDVKLYRVCGSPVCLR